MFFHHACEVSINTGIYYAKIMERIWQRWPPKSSTKTEAHLASLGVDINDVWVVAVAWEHGLIVLTQDKMQAIKDVTTEVEFDCWI